MSAALVVITDGRFDYLDQAIRSAERNLGPFDHRILVDDTGDPAGANLLEDYYPQFRQVHHAQRQGLGGAVASAWHAAAETAADTLFHLEDDFTFNTAIPVRAMVDCLDRHPELVQLVLKRQPWSSAEVAAGGQIELAPDEHEECTDGQAVWVEHRRLFSFNPSLIRRDVFARDWGPVLEADVTRIVNQNPDHRYAYWGARTDPPLCHHIGMRRSDGYRW